MSYPRARKTLDGIKVYLSETYRDPAAKNDIRELFETLIHEAQLLYMRVAELEIINSELSKRLAKLEKLHDNRSDHM